MQNNFSNYNKSAFKGDIFQGDLDYEDSELEGDLDITYGDVEAVSLTQGDLEEILDGGPPAKVVARKKGAVRPAGAPGKQAVVRKSAFDKPLNVPGAAITSSLIPTLIVDNAKIIVWGQDKQVAGSLIKHLLDAHATEYIAGTISATSAGAGPGSPTAMVFDNTDLPSGYEYCSAPVIFVTISASQLNARPGARFKVKLTGKAMSGAPIADDEWVVERINSNIPVKLTIFPVARFRDRIVPVRGKFGHSIGGTPVALTVTVTDAVSDESVSVIVPGIDSEELTNFLKTWNIPR